MTGGVANTAAPHPAPASAGDSGGCRVGREGGGTRLPDSRVKHGNDVGDAGQPICCFSGRHAAGSGVEGA